MTDRPRVILFAEPIAGSFGLVTADVCNLVYITGREISFTFNEVKMVVNPGDHPKDIQKNYDRLYDEMIDRSSKKDIVDRLEGLATSLQDDDLHGDALTVRAAVAEIERLRVNQVAVEPEKPRRITPEAAVASLGRLSDDGGFEGPHAEADEILQAVLRHLGHPEVADAFDKACTKHGFRYS